MECNSVCLGIQQFFGNLLVEVAVGGVILLWVIGAIRAVISSYEDHRSKSFAKKIERLDSEIQELLQTILEEYPAPTPTSDGIPQRFPSKRAAQVFGERWSRGDQSSFIAKAVDASGYDEDHPRFDKTSVRSGILYSKPALFFGMKQAYRGDDVWSLEYQRAHKSWLENYLNQRRKGATSY
jgi:hypothetical protein